MSSGSILTRRAALAGLAAGVALAPTRLAFAQAAGATAAAGNKLVLVLLRGGLDGLALLPPYGDPDYRAARGALALPPPGEPGGAVPLDARFALHPAAGALLAPWRAERLAIAVAAAGPYVPDGGAAAHARARRAFAAGTGRADGPGAQSGWLNRALQLRGEGPPTLALAGAGRPEVLAGPAAVETAPPAVLGAPVTGLLEKAQAMYRGDALLGPALPRALDVRDRPAETLGGEHVAEAAAGARGPFDFAAAAREAGGRLGAADGPDAAVLEVAGFDLHFQAGAREGVQARRLAALATGLTTLADALGPAYGRTVIMVVSEFGRSIAPNRAGGTDHGRAGPVLLMGGPVIGGIKGGWPGLAVDKRAENGGLAPAVDVRGVLKRVLGDHWGLSAAQLDGAVLPDAGGVAPLKGLIREG
ncbi:MAG: DUF1501 domain-containing protein [Marivibrio sp.]|uniref:DUF1501 domain-containing protein n=1 Tax=Marivibrio sp. TaxID=2039719 RepID=UPI0032EEA58F